GDLIQPFNPLSRVPTLVLDDGSVVIESAAILDYLDELTRAQTGAEAALIPERGPGRRAQLHIMALATGLADKAVGLMYERLLHEVTSADWMARCQRQIAGVLAALERDHAARPTDYWFGDRIGHADIAVASALRFLGDAHPDAFDPERWPALGNHAAWCEALAVFQEICQPLVVPR
ncbi:MAG: glutathione S-transferase family protein, partial [Proteobacteria bacterium]|nr:glutathione S-transferase family protein [Pseudomonadota bacterium]